MNYKISIIIPVYNTAKYLRNCLDSIIRQTLQEIEIILVDDCSTDGSGEICDQYAALDGRIVVIHNSMNIRQGKSRNIGIELAKGEYIGFIDSDDYIENDFFECLYKAAHIHAMDIAKAECIQIMSDGSQKKSSSLNDNIKKGISQGLPIFVTFTYEHWSAIYKKSLFSNPEVRYPDIRNGQDVIFLMIITYYAQSITLTDKTHYYYRIHPESTVSVKSEEFYKSALQCFKLQSEFLNSHPMNKVHYELIFHKLYLTLIRHLDTLKLSPEPWTIKILFIEQVCLLSTTHKYDPDLLIKIYMNTKVENNYCKITKTGITNKFLIIISKIINNILPTRI